MTLTLISVESDYMIREDEAGDEIVTTLLPVAHPLTEWADVDLTDAWQLAALRHHEAVRVGTIPYSYRPDHETFLAELRRNVTDPDEVEVEWCEDCEVPIRADEAHWIDGSEAFSCESCFEDNYTSCGDCGNTVHNDTTVYTLHDESVCQRCSDNNYSYCEDCDGYYHHDYADEHSHGSCDCDVPTHHLTMPNGETTLSADERVSVSLPAGTISDEGIDSISRLILNYYYSLPVYNAKGNYDEALGTYRVKWYELSRDVYTMSPEWQTKEGNFTKRLSKLAHKNHGLKFPPELLTKVGNVGRDQSNGAEIELELTRNLNLPAEDFYHDDSCWWQSYGDSRCALKTNGGIGMRTFEGPYNRVAGRAWLMPLRLTEPRGTLAPTFDAQGADAYMVFNGYGDLSGYTPARIVADMAGMTYRKVEFDCSPMYVNNNAGYLIAPEELAQKYPAGSRVSLRVETHSDRYNTERQAELVGA